MSAARGRVIVHLIHGTWARGFFGGRKAWTVGGSDVCLKLTAALPPGTSLEPFLWSGRNSFSARSEASNELRRHLVRSAGREPDAAHVVVAHSHGGTVASQALLDKPLVGVDLRAIVCLATPFVFVSESSQSRRETAVQSVSAVMFAVLCLTVLSFFTSAVETVPTLIFTAVVALISLLVLWPLAVVVAKHVRPMNAGATRTQDQTTVPLYLLRATRDEASLILSIAQFFDWLCAGFSRSIDQSQFSVRRPARYAAFFVAWPLCLLLGATIAEHLFPLIELSLDGARTMAIVLFVLTPAVAGVIYLFGYALLAAMVGHFDVSEWMTSELQVDAAPPNVRCSLIVYSLTEVSPTGGLRHALYESDKVVKDIADIVRLVAS